MQILHKPCCFSRSGSWFLTLLILGLLVMPKFSQAAATNELLPVGNGFYHDWSGDSKDINEGMMTPSCESLDYISSSDNNDRSSFVVGLSTVPNGAVITGVSVKAADRAYSFDGGTYATFMRLNGVDSSNSAVHTAMGHAGACTGNRDDFFAVNNLVKTKTSSLEIGVIKLGSSKPAGYSLRVGAMAAVVTYSVPAPAISTQALPGGKVGAFYQQTLIASGGTPNYSWSVESGSLPAGLSLSPAGIIAGTSTAAGNARAVYRVTDSLGMAATTSLSLTIDKADQTIIFNPIGDKTYGDADFAISASSTGRLPLNFTTTGGCSVIGGKIHLVQAGSCSVTAKQAGDTNYNAAPDVTQTFNAAKKFLTVKVNGKNKVYDASTNAAVDYSILGVVGNDQVNAQGTALFASKNVGLQVPITVTGIALSGAAAGNYLVNDTAQTAADITKAFLSVAATGVNKTYDGTKKATVIFTSNKLGSDDVSINGEASFADKNVGAGKPVTVENITLAGADAQNYDLLNNTSNTTADINVKDLKIIATGVSRVYVPGDSSAKVELATDALPGDNVIPAFTEAAFDSPEAGAGKPIHVSGMTISGADASNYNLTNDSAETAANITPNLATITLDTSKLSRPYGGTAQTVQVLSTDPAGLSTVVFYNGSLEAPKDAGTYKVLGAVVSQDYAGTAEADLVISKIDQTITFDPLAAKDFGSSDFTVSAVASSNLPIEFSASGACTVTNKVVHLTTKGTCAVTAAQPGDNNYNAAAPVTQTFTVNDVTAPVIKLHGENPLNLVVGDKYIEPGAEASDDVDANVSVSVGGDVVNTAATSTFHITYDAVDASNNHAVQVIRTVNVNDKPAPIISVEESSFPTASSVTVNWITDHPATSRVVFDTVSHADLTQDANYGYASSTEEDTNLVTNHSVTISGLVSGQVYYLRAVSHGSPESIGVEIMATTTDVIPPVITVLGDNPLQHLVGQVYVDPGATSSDNLDGDLTASIAASSTVNASTTGTYVVTYSVADKAGNMASSTRTVYVVDATNTLTEFHHSSSASPLVGDTNYDGQVDKYDLATLMSNWGKTGYNPADLNHDNVVDKLDLALLMASWSL